MKKSTLIICKRIHYFKMKEKNISENSIVNNRKRCSTGGIRIQAKNSDKNQLIDDHPCYSYEASKKFARLHLPVAPKCNIQCNYCDRKYDCVNESRPGVTSRVLDPEAATLLVHHCINQKSNIKVVGISGPGDPLANAEETFITFKNINKYYPEIHLCISTNGLKLREYLSDIIACGIKHVTVTVNMIDPEIGKNIYAYAFYQNRKLEGKEASELIAEVQAEAISLLVKNNILCKVNTVVIPGINDHHIPEIANTCSKLGVYIHNIIPMIYCENTNFSRLGIKSPSKKMLTDISLKCDGIIRTMHHCKRCRADAIGYLTEEKVMEIA